MAYRPSFNSLQPPPHVSTSSSLGDIRPPPLFNHELNAELQALERRAAAVDVGESSSYYPNARHASSSQSQQSYYPGLASLSPPRTTSVGGAVGRASSPVVGGTHNNNDLSFFPKRSSLQQDDLLHSHHSPPTVLLHLGHDRAALFSSLPPKIQRPWSVEVLLQRSEEMLDTTHHRAFGKQQLTKHSGEGKVGGGRRGKRSGGGGGGGEYSSGGVGSGYYGGNEGGRGTRTAAAGGPSQDRLHRRAAAGGSDGDEETSDHDEEAHHPLQHHSAALRNSQPGAAHRLQETDVVSGLEHLKVRTSTEGGTAGPLLGAASVGAPTFGTQPSAPGAEWMHPMTDAAAGRDAWVEDDAVFQGLIERAAARRQIQRERLEKKGVSHLIPGASQEGDAQTDPHATRYAPDSHGVPKIQKIAAASSPQRSQTASTSTQMVSTGVGPSPTRGANSGAAPSSNHSTASQGGGGGPIVLPAMGYKPYSLPKDHLQSDTVWKAMLVEDQRKNAGLSLKFGSRMEDNHYERTEKLTGVPSAMTLAKYSSASADYNPNYAVPKGVEGLIAAAAAARSTPPPEAGATDKKPAAAPQFESTKSRLLQDIEHMQRANEELAARNHFLGNESTLSVDPALRNALSRVSDAVVQSTQLNAAGLRAGGAPPTGGYGSVRDGPQSSTHSSQAALQPSGSYLPPSEAEPIRRWATESPSVVAAKHRTPNLVAASSSSRGGAKSGDGYDARRKWGNVSFEQKGTF